MASNDVRLAGSNEEAAGNRPSDVDVALARGKSGDEMEAGRDVDAEDLVVVEADGGGGDEEEDDDEVEVEVEVTAYTNSNYKSVSSSKLVAGSCCAVRDPAVDVVIVEHVDDIRDCSDDDDDGGDLFDDGEASRK